MLKLGHLELFVTDPLRSLTFYRDRLGFRVVDVQAETYVWLESNGMELLLRPGKPSASVASYEETSLALVLYTDDLAATIARLEEQGIELFSTEPTGQCYNFTDPDGHWIQVVDPNHN